MMEVEDIRRILYPPVHVRVWRWVRWEVRWNVVLCHLGALAVGAGIWTGIILGYLHRAGIVATVTGWITARTGPELVGLGLCLAYWMGLMGVWIWQCKRR